MNFMQRITEHYEKLENKEIINLLWREILRPDRTVDNIDDLIEYSFHFPVDSDSYLEELHELFDEQDKEELRTIDGHLRAYLITFIYYCTNRFTQKISMKSAVLASNLYIKLISIDEIGKYYFERNMLKLQLMVCLMAARDDDLPEQYKMDTMKLLKVYFMKESMEMYLLKAVANTFTGVMMILTKVPVDSLQEVNYIPMFCMATLKEYIVNERDDTKLKGAMEGLFRCLGKNMLVYIQDQYAARTVVKVFIRDILQEELDEDKFQALLDAFAICWGKSDFINYPDAVGIMNILKIQYYKELLRKMMKYSQSVNHRRFLQNIMNLLVAMAKELPPFPLEKIEVIYSCVLRNIVQCLVDKDHELVDRCIETISNLCFLNDNQLLSITFNNVYITGKFVSMSVEALFLCMSKISDEKWGISPRNQNLLVIFARILSSSKSINTELVEKTLNDICRDFTPFSLLPVLPVLHELFGIMARKGEVASARIVLKILYKSAMHQDSCSMEFAEHLFQHLLAPSTVNGVTYPSKYYYNILLTADFEYEALFTKCQKYIRSYQVDQVIEEFDYREPGAAVLLCCLLNYCRYEEITTLLPYFVSHFNQIATRETMGPLCIAFRKILSDKTIEQDDLPQLDVLHCCLLEALFDQTYQIPSIKPAYDLLQKLRCILRIETQDQVLNQLLTVTSERAFRRMHKREIGDHSVFMYLNELCVLMKKMPSENVIALLEDYMNDENKVKEMNDIMPEIYLQLLTLFTTLAMMTKRKIPVAQKYLQEVLSHESQISKILGFKLYYALCKEMTREFDHVVKFVFKEVGVADPCLVRLCVVAIEELVHNDYIKFDSESFFKFIHVVGSDDLGIFMREMLMKRFMFSNQSDITKFYVQTIMHLHVYTKMSNYPISPDFYEELLKMKLKFSCKKEIPVYLFKNLTIKNKFNILHEISFIFDDFVRGQCKIEENFFPVMQDLLMTYRFIKYPCVESLVDKHYFSNVCSEIETKIVKADRSYTPQNYYSEFDNEIRKCTVSLLKLIFLEDPQISEHLGITLFDALMHWIDFVKDEIIHYIHVEKGREYGKYFSKLLQYYRRNKGRFTTPDSFSLEPTNPL